MPPDQPNLNAVKQYLLGLQNTICSELGTLETNVSFEEDSWGRAEGGGGQARVLSEGLVFEKAGVNFSHVSGKQLPSSATKRRPELTGKPFEAMGVSLVVHPLNPYVPTTHMNVRFFKAGSGSSCVWWFGGGFDLTPYYPFKKDCVHWHTTAKAACEPFGEDVYPTMKKACDEYFFLPHRQEARGIGGLFFDDYCKDSFDHSFLVMQSVANHFLAAYMPIVERRRNIEYAEREIEFQHYRRGRYVEFNLVHDRGTLFGLQSGGRTESILMSLPPKVSWKYDWQPQENSPEHALYTYFLPIQDWVNPTES